jgi:hypothetical protein
MTEFLLEKNQVKVISPSFLNVAFRTHTGHNHVSVRNMEKNHINVRNLEKLPGFHIFRKTIGLIVEREAMRVGNVGKPSIIPFSLKYMKALTLKRSPLYRSNAGKSLVLLVTLQYMKGFTLDRSPTYVSNVRKPSFL